MAAPGGKFFIQDKLKDVAPHHESFEEGQKEPVSTLLSRHPPLRLHLRHLLTGSPHPKKYDWDKYAQAFFPKAEELVAEAEKAEKEGNQEKASEFYLRGSAVYRISRFPAPRSEKQRHAWAEGKKAAKKGLALRERPTKEMTIPHKHGLANEGKEINFYYHLPPGTTKEKPVPLVIILSGLDGYRTELAVWIEGWSQKQVAVIVLEIPGTGDSPAAANDPTSPEREWSSLFD
ncbi:hypothetical protein LTR09_006238 [Extremus antarcticus]|uniref:Uncharacterized protein n=1 Tax=Extremus antarcticus TaxID=702011 RepID=A0AAJ0DLP0_9PEZI|nr:hypothetical protein LTR09_006238 [Extremus antarcticus]